MILSVTGLQNHLHLASRRCRTGPFEVPHQLRLNSWHRTVPSQESNEKSTTKLRGHWRVDLPSSTPMSSLLLDGTDQTTGPAGDAHQTAQKAVTLSIPYLFCAHILRDRLPSHINRHQNQFVLVKQICNQTPIPPLANSKLL